MTKRETKRDRLSRLLGEVDPAIIQEALDTDSPEALAALKAKERRERFVLSVPHRRILIASVAMLVAVALVLPIALRLGGQLGVGGGTDIPGPTIPVDPGSVTPPWVSGELKLTSLTYGEDKSTQGLSYPSFSLLSSVTETEGGTEDYGESGTEETATSTEENTDGETTDDPIYGVGDNYTVSILPNMKITDYLEGGLIKLRPDSGEHTFCPDVYYDIAANEYVCLSCKVGDMLIGSEIYTEAALACLIDECLLYYSPLMGAGMMEDFEAQYRSALLRSDIVGKLAEKKRITQSALSKLNFYDDGHMDFMKEQVGRFEYPIVDVVEYGADLSRCIVTIVSPRTGMGYGNFLCDLNTGTLISMDGGMEADEVPNLSLATSVIITDDYATAVITAPYYVTYLLPDSETGLFIPQYTRSNIFLYDLSRMTCTSMAEGDVGYAPATEGKESMGVITYKGINGTHYAYYKGVHYPLSGEPLRICRDREGYRYAVVASGDGYAFHLLAEEGGASPVPPSELEWKLDIANCYLVEGNRRINLLSGETITLWEGTPAAQVSSRDGRYIYLYFEGEAVVRCVDVWTEQRGSIALDETFLEEIASAEGISYRLLMNQGEDRLLMTYFKESTVAFDAESFLNVHPSERRGLVATVEDIINHFTVNGRPLKFYEKSRAVQLSKLLFLPAYLDMIAQGDTSNWKQLCVEVGEQMIPYLDVWANSAERPTSVVAEKIGVLSADQLTELFRIRYGQYEAYLFTEETIPSNFGKRRDYALDGYTRFWRDIFLKYYGVAATEENTDYLDALIHSRLDAIVSEEVTYTKVELQQTLETLLTEAAPTILGYSYGEFLQNAAFFAYHEPWWGEYGLTTDETAGDIRCSPRQYVDQDYVRSFLSSVTFTEGDVEIRPAARISCRLSSVTVTLVELGYAEDGRAYVRAHGVYAEITPEDVETFKSEAVSKQTTYEPIVVDRPW